MARLSFDKSSERYYESGIDHVVLYPASTSTVEESGDTKEVTTYENGVAWNGVTSITETPEGGEMNDLWADNMKYASLQGAEKFGGSIEAYQSPAAFDECDGSASLVGKKGVHIGQQSRKPFGLSYRTRIGVGADNEKGYKIHVIYGCKATPSERSYETINDNPDAQSMNWDFDSTGESVTIGTEEKTTNTLTFDYYGESDNGAHGLTKAQYNNLCDTLWGSATKSPSIPLPDALIAAVFGS